MKRNASAALAALLLFATVAFAQSGTTGSFPVESPIPSGPVVDGAIGGPSIVDNGAVSGNLQPIPAQPAYGSDVPFGGEVATDPITAGGPNCGCNGSSMGGAAPIYDSYSVPTYTQSYMPTVDYSWPTYNARGYGYRPLFGGLLGRRNCCP